MFGYLKEAWRCRELKARAERLLREQMLELIERQQHTPAAEEAEDWTAIGQSSPGKSSTGQLNIRDLRQQARELVEQNPHARNYLRLLEIYVVGPGLSFVPTLRGDSSELDAALLQDVKRLWDQFLRANVGHYSFREHARRTWRDGECFIRIFASGEWPPQLRFVDPELIDEVAPYQGSQGIITREEDVESPLYYLLLDRKTGGLKEEVSSEEMLHTRYGVDSNEKRGQSVLLTLIEPIHQFEKWLDTELQARKLQTSIVLWRKVQGSAAQLSGMIDANSSAGFGGKEGSVRKEKIRPGSIFTTSAGTELKFLQPDTNFTDAVPLGRMLLLCQAAAAGLPEFMLTADASNSNLASTLIAEGPAVKYFEAEQHYFIEEFNKLWSWVMQAAIEDGLVPADIFDRIEPKWSLPKIVVHNRSQERLADTRLVEAEIISKAEVARRDGVEPEKMQREISEEKA